MKVLALLLLSALLIAAQSAVAASQPNGVDCGALLAALYNVIKMSRPPGGSGSLLALYANASLPGDLGRAHARVAQDLVELREAYSSYASLNFSSSLARELINIGERLQEDALAYASRLSACAADKATSDALYSKVAVLVKEIRSWLEGLAAEVLAASSSGASVEVDKEVIKPGDALKVTVALARPGDYNGTVALAAWPSQLFIAWVNASVSGSRGTFEIRVPAASELADIGDFSSVAVVVRLESAEGVMAYAFKLIKLEVSRPGLLLSMPAVAHIGDTIRVDVVADGRYNATVTIDNFTVFEGELVEGHNVLEIDTARLSPGIHTLTIAIPPGTTALGAELTRQFMLLERSVRVEASAPPVVASFLPAVPVAIKVVEPRGERVAIELYVDGAKALYLPEASGATAFVGVGLAIVKSVKITVVARAESPSYSPYELSLSVLYINPGLVLASSLGALAALLSIAKSERELYVALRGVSLGRPRRSGPRLMPERAPPQVLSLHAKVAGIYYRLLERLGLDLPGVSETLREHLRRLSPPRKLADLLWRLVKLVEAELYSKHKPDPREAERVAEEVEEAEG